MNRHKTTAQLSMLSYQSPLTIFDNQECYDKIFPRPVDIYKTSSHSSNVISIFERDRDNEDFAKACDEILFQVFLHEYKLQYVGKTHLNLDTKSSQSQLLQSQESRLRF